MSDEQPKPKRPPEQVAVGYIKEAEAYRLAALRVHPPGTQNADVNLLAPAWHLLCHSSELALKAFLLSHGADPGGKKGGLMHIDMRHKLMRLYEAALARGFKAPDDEFRELIEWLAPYHSNHVFRYREPGRIWLASPFLIGEILEPVISDIARIVQQRWMAAHGPGQADEELRKAGLVRAIPPEGAR